jgi:hypothetical protein
LFYFLWTHMRAAYLLYNKKQSTKVQSRPTQTKQASSRWPKAKIKKKMDSLVKDGFISKTRQTTDLISRRGWKVEQSFSSSHHSHIPFFTKATQASAILSERPSNTQVFNFQIVHAPRMTMVLNPYGLIDPSSSSVARLHHKKNLYSSTCGASRQGLTQVRRRWSLVSTSWSHKTSLMMWETFSGQSVSSPTSIMSHRSQEKNCT